MRIGVPKEIKSYEHRVALVPSSVRELVQHGHDVLVEKQAGMGISIHDDDYLAVGATLADSTEHVFKESELIIKVKEPQPEECRMLREGQTIFTFLHLAPDPVQAQLLKEAKCTAIAYETVTDDQGRLPLLYPMSQVAGRMSIQAGAHALEKTQHGRGILLGGVAGVEPAHVVVIGGGVVGTNAIRIALGMCAHVTVLDRTEQRLNELTRQFGKELNTVLATEQTIEDYVLRADLVVGAVLVPGAHAPKLVSSEVISKMKKGAVLVDVAIDQGGCFATSKPTTHDNPTYVEQGVVHYCVANMPGAVPRTSTFALNNATLPYILALADQGITKALLSDPHLANGLNIHRGRFTYAELAKDLNYPYVPIQDALTAD